MAVVCHDAGAANLVLPWLAIDKLGDVRPVMQGPAERLWRARFASIALREVEAALDGAALLLSGTGWESDLEHRARKLARKHGIRSIAVIDHWINYRERFVRSGETVLPDEIWVTDDEALAIARHQFPDLPVRLRPNLYLQEQLSKTPPLAEADRDVLFLAEPLRTDWGRGAPGEFQALEYFLSRRQTAGVPDDAPVRIRLHPSEALDKYDHWAGAHISIDRSPELAGSLAGARWAVGCESYALVVALKAGREAISALPPWAPHCRLPHQDVVRLASL